MGLETAIIIGGLAAGGGAMAAAAMSKPGKPKTPEPVVRDAQTMDNSAEKKRRALYERMAKMRKTTMFHQLTEANLGKTTLGAGL